MPNQLSGIVGLNSTLQVIAVDICSGLDIDLTGPANFSSSNANILTVDNDAVVDFVGPGTAQANFSVLHSKAWQVTNCRDQTSNGSCAVTVHPQVTITGSDNVALRTGSSSGPNQLNLTADVAPTGGTFLWTTTSSKVTLSNTSSATVTVTSQTESSQVGDVPIKVKYTVNGQFTEKTKNITVRKPNSLSVTSDSTNPSGNTCDVSCLANPGSGTCAFTGQSCSYSSYVRTRDYSTLDQFGTSFSSLGLNSVDVQEQVPVTGTCPNIQGYTGNATTANFTDTFFMCSHCCLSGGPGCSISTNTVQTITANGFTVRQVSVNWSCSSVSLNP